MQPANPSRLNFHRLESVACVTALSHHVGADFVILEDLVDCCHLSFEISVSFIVPSRKWA